MSTMGTSDTQFLDMLNNKHYYTGYYYLFVYIHYMAYICTGLEAYVKPPIYFCSLVPCTTWHFLFQTRKCYAMTARATLLHRLRKVYFHLWRHFFTPDKEKNFFMCNILNAHQQQVLFHPGWTSMGHPHCLDHDDIGSRTSNNQAPQHLPSLPIILFFLNMGENLYHTIAYLVAWVNKSEVQ
jgi:hypothetical protein